MPRFLVLDADAGGAALLAIALDKRGTLTVESATNLPAEAPLAAGAAEFGATLRDALKASAIRPAPLLILVGRERVIVKDVKYPPTPPADEPAVVRFQASRELADAAGDVVMDYLPLGNTADGERRAQALFLRKDVLAAAQLVAVTAGLRLAGVAPRPFALAALVERVAPSGTVALFAPAARGGEFVIVRAGEVLFGRSVPGAATESAKTLAVELKRNLTVASGMPGVGPVERLVIAESPEAVPNWAGQLGGSLSVAVESFDPLAGHGAAAESVPVRQRGLFAGPVGLALSRAASRTLPVNFIDPRRPRAEPGKNRPKVFIAALVGVVVLAGITLVALEALSEADADLVSLRAQTKELEEEAARLQLDSARLAAADAFAAREVVWLDELYDLSVRVEDVGKVSVASYSAEPVAPTKPKPGIKPKPEPIANVRFEASTTTEVLTQAIADTYLSDVYAVNFGKTITSQQGARGTVYTFAGSLMRRPPADYDLRLDVTMPKPPPEERDEVTVITLDPTPARETP